MAYVKQLNVGGVAYDIKAAADLSGNLIESSYLKLSGGTMTGDLTLKKSTTIANNYPAKLNFAVNQTNNNLTYTSYIAVYDDHDANNYGTNMVLKSGGNMILGGGEAPENYYNASLKDDSGEACYIVTDGNIFLKPGMNTVTSPNGGYYVQVDPAHNSNHFVVRNINYGTGAPSGGSDGDVYIRYL